MSQNRAALIGKPGKAAEVSPTAKQLSLAVSPLDKQAASEPKREPSWKYVPIYHVQLIRDRQIKIEPQLAVHSPENVVAILQDELLQADREKLICLMLNAKHNVVGMEIVSVGTLTSSLAHPREIFKAAILRNSAAIILAHNHPSGNPAPSQEDCELTKRIAQAGQLLGIELLDHVILAEQGSYSFRTSGKLT